VSDTLASLRRKIDSAGDLQAVVRTMKALAASSIGQYEAAVRALADYYRTVELGLGVCLREWEPTTAAGEPQAGTGAGAEHAIEALAAHRGDTLVWAVGERVHARLADAGLRLAGVFAVPNSVRTITPLVGQILLETGTGDRQGGVPSLHLFFNRPAAGEGYVPGRQQLLPLDEGWRRDLAGRPWPTGNLPDVMGRSATTVRRLISEYLFVSLFRACAESLASENASRLAAMERADRNIDELLEHLQGGFHRLRQSGIDEELFDVIAGFEALITEKTR
jgi:F-type H+-transporting ATPase subunit gamma